MRMPLFLAVMAALTAPLALAPAAMAGTRTTLNYSDLDLDTEAGRAELDKRIAKAARELCSTQIRTGSHLPTGMCIANAREQLAARVEDQMNRVGKGG